ncbi:MAG TPA: DUF4349 domain-containing protein [Gaiellaceae bacterium]|nr:DUF4349 domain-containing protein [Gaiellaceae bacterium]
MSPLELVGDLDGIARELRASRPAASPALRQRVLALEAPEPRFAFRLPSRRLVLALAALALLASFVAAALTGLGGGTTRSSSGGAVSTHPPIAESRAKSPGPVTHALEGAKLAAPYALPPTAGRLQRYDATLRLRVHDLDGLSRATQRAVNLTRGLGGYVGSVDYSTRSGKRGGAATLVLRVPVANIQAELDGLTDLGTILQQRTGILDVTRRSDREARQIAALERELAAASPQEAPAIRARLATLRAKHARLLRSARLARIVLGLATPSQQAATPPGRLHRTLDDAGKVLVRELEILIYALVVAGPLLLLGAAGIATARTVRRRSDRRLLERA